MIKLLVAIVLISSFGCSTFSITAIDKEGQVLNIETTEKKDVKPDTESPESKE